MIQWTERNNDVCQWYDGYEGTTRKFCITKPRVCNEVYLYAIDVRLGSNSRTFDAIIETVKLGKDGNWLKAVNDLKEIAERKNSK